MVTPEQVRSYIEKGLQCSEVRVAGDGQHFEALIVSEAIGIGLLALGVGLAAGYGAAQLFVHRGNLSQLSEPDFTAGVFAWGLAFALGVAVIGALYPARRAVRLTPIEALRRE